MFTNVRRQLDREHNMNKILEVHRGPFVHKCHEDFCMILTIHGMLSKNLGSNMEQYFMSKGKKKEYKVQHLKKEGRRPIGYKHVAIVI